MRIGNIAKQKTIEGVRACAKAGEEIEFTMLPGNVLAIVCRLPSGARYIEYFAQQSDEDIIHAMTINDGELIIDIKTTIDNADAKPAEYVPLTQTGHKDVHYSPKRKSCVIQMGDRTGIPAGPHMEWTTKLIAGANCNKEEDIKEAEEKTRKVLEMLEAAGEW